MLLNRPIHIYNIYNPLNADKISTSISILERRLAKHPNEKYLAFWNLNFYHEAWKKKGALRALIEKSEKLIMITQRWEIERIVPVGTTTYKKSIGKNIIIFIFATPFVSKSLISCSIEETFDYNLDHQPISSWWTLQTVDNSCSSCLFLSKMDVPKLKKNCCKTTS